MITTTEPRPLFTDLGDLARTITNAIREQQRLGLEAEAIHINPRMLEIMDQMAAMPIKQIGPYPIVPDATVQMQGFRVKIKRGALTHGSSTGIPSAAALQVPQRSGSAEDKAH